MIALSAFYLAVAPYARAESVQWAHVAGTDLCPIDYVGAPRCGGSGITNPHMQITYSTRVVDLTTGEVIPCGSSVAAGTQLKYEFVSHQYSDIDWFAGTGYFDSPYGDWQDTLDQPDNGNMCKDKNYVGLYTGGGYESGTWKFYSPLVVLQPTKSIAGLPTSFECTALGGGSQSCTPTEAGTFTPVFTFAPTRGVFYLGFNRGTPPARADGSCDVNSSRGIPLSANHYIGSSGGIRYTWSNDGTYYLEVPEQTISCPITIQPPVGSPPAKPTVSSAACVVGSSETLTMNATDPDGDTVRYGVDWDANDAVDQWVPPTGYVSSGTMQTASRIYSIPGSKTVKVVTQDKNGRLSEWTTVTFRCAGSATVGINENGNGGNGGGGGGDGGGSGALLLLPDLDLRVVPSLLRSGDTTKVNWSSENVASCSVSGQNGDAWTGLLSPVGGQTSKPIMAQTTYTLTCVDLYGGTLTKQATVRIIPSFRER